MRSIPQIDQDIEAIRKALLARAPVLSRLVSAGHAQPKDWQAAWGANPDLSDRSLAAWCERGVAQLARDQREEAMRIKAAQRPLRNKKCPACHGTGRVAA